MYESRKRERERERETLASIHGSKKMVCKHKYGPLFRMLGFTINFHVPVYICVCVVFFVNVFHCSIYIFFLFFSEGPSAVLFDVLVTHCHESNEIK